MIRRVTLTAAGGMLAMLLLSSAAISADYGADSKMASSAYSTDATQPLEQLIATWPEVSRTAAQFAINKYGPPDSWSSDMLHYYGVEPFDYMVVYRDPVEHAFPVAHQDVLEQGVYYAVPADKVDELAAFDGSVLIDRTAGTLSAKCDKEGANFLALNLAIDIIENRTTVNEARSLYAMAINDFLSTGEMHPYMTALNFEPQTQMFAAFTDSPATAVAGVSRSRDTYVHNMDRGHAMGRYDSRHGYWDECCNWVSYSCPTGYRSYDYRGNRYAERYDFDTYYRDGVVAGVMGYRDYPTSSMIALDTQRQMEYDRIFGTGGMSNSWTWRGNERVWTGGYAWVDGERMWIDADDMYWMDNRWHWRDDPDVTVRLDNDSWVWRGNDRVWTGGYAWVNGNRVWVDADNMYWQDNRWHWRDDPDAVIRFDEDRFNIDDDRFEVDSDRFDVDIDRDRLEVDPDRFNVDEDRLRPELDID